MKIFWKDQAAYDEHGNFLAMIHQLTDAQFYGFINYTSDEIDFKQVKIKTITLQMATQQIEDIFSNINDISQIEKVLNHSVNDADLPIQFLELFTEFSIHRP